MTRFYDFMHYDDLELALNLTRQLRRWGTSYELSFELTPDGWLWCVACNLPF